MKVPCQWSMPRVTYLYTAVASIHLFPVVCISKDRSKLGVYAVYVPNTCRLMSMTDSRACGATVV